MDIIERLNDPELYIDAVDDAIREIERLRHVVEMYKLQLGIEKGTIDALAIAAGVAVIDNKHRQVEAIANKIMDAQAT